MLLQRRDAPAPRLSRTAARLPKALDPDNRRAGTDINLLGRRAPRRPAFNFRNHSRPHVFRIGLRHRPASQNRINADRLSHPSPSENLLDSIGTEHALAILWLALRSARIIFAVAVSITLGLAMSAAWGLFLIGALNLISLGFFVLFVGLGIDFGIQFSVRYRAERHDCDDLRAAAASANGPPAFIAVLCKAMKAGGPLALAAAATAV